MFNNIDQAIDYIYSFINLEVSEKKYKTNTYSLENIKKLITLFNIDILKFKIIHVAGTKGKGSTTLFITYLLNELGYKTASFLSPHVKRINERILYNQKEISDDELIQLVSFVKETLNKSSLIPTTFELLFIIFLLFCNKKDIDYLVIEVGLGGRLDTTNVVKPIVSVITPIGYDHMDVLGSTLKLIAKEKAGIIKDNTPVVSNIQKSSCKSVIKNVCKKRNSPIYFINKDFKLTSYKVNGLVSKISFKFKNTVFKDITLYMYGIHQVYNLFTAILSVYLVDKKVIGYLKSCKEIKLKLNARLEIVCKNPLILVDVAHNYDSAKVLVKTLKTLFPAKKWIVLSSMAKGKDYKKFYKIISKIAHKIIITSCSEFKESEPEVIYKNVFNYFKKVVLIENFDDAYDFFIKQEGNLLVTGSFYVVSPFLNKFENKNDI